jgi:hypothetical protein
MRYWFSTLLDLNTLSLRSVRLAVAVIISGKGSGRFGTAKNRPVVVKNVRASPKRFEKTESGISGGARDIRRLLRKAESLRGWRRTTGQTSVSTGFEVP